jgi:purine nucleoside phosphorylase
VGQARRLSNCCGDSRPRLLTNLAASLTKEKLGHEEFLEVGKKAAADFARLLRATAE